ncbi:membrane-bound ghrelin O-acyltransferase mboat4 [Echeneis naucrates]|uniref:membrane-bound ghrelin O-acyltransferase mboat4 n=1 Tax=Echeneis naucrates TaxID=173247 RepID=UPI001113D7FD|nr:ghrelin O-acyltransferase [Echeneis naucrates]
MIEILADEFSDLLIELTSDFRYLVLSVGGCVLAVFTMRLYSVLLFIPVFVFILLLSFAPCSVHNWVFGIQMLWQTFWHLFVQYREYCSREPVSIRLFLALSSLMLLTQRITSLSMDLQEKRVMITFNASSKRKLWDKPQASTQHTGSGFPTVDAGVTAGVST